MKDGPAAYFSTLPVKAMAKNISEHNIPTSISYTAGTFVCNDIMYRLLYMIEYKYPEIRGGFIHVPYCTAQVQNRAGNTPNMAVETIAKGLEYAIEAVCKYEQDIQVHAGATH